MSEGGEGWAREQVQARYDRAVAESAKYYDRLPAIHGHETEARWLARVVEAGHGGDWWAWRASMCERASSLALLDALRQGAISA